MPPAASFLLSRARLSFQLLLFFCLIFVIRFPCAVAVTNLGDKNVLVDLYTAWSSNPLWDISTDPCDDNWLGVQCDVTNTTVVELTLLNQRLTGILPPTIGKLKNLTTLDLSSNPGLRGSLPADIGNLTNLQKFYVQFCNFSGEIPSTIGAWTNMRFIGLTRNSFTGPIPDTIGFLKNLLWLDLNGNLLNGRLPDSTSSAIGSGLDNLTNALHFHLHNNSFSGGIPSSIFNTRMHIIHLLLYNNPLQGTIPSNVGDLLHAKIVRLDSCGLTGSIPSGFATMQNLTTLMLNNNSLTGQLLDLSNSTKLQILDLGNNGFDVSSIPAWLTTFPNLQLLSLPSVNLTGTIPPKLFAQQNISNVTLGSNNLNGTLNLTMASPTLLRVNVTYNSISNLNRGTYAHELLLDGNPYCNSNPTNCADFQSGSSPALSSPQPSPDSACTNTCPAEYAVNSRLPGNCQCARPVVTKYIFEAIITPLLTDYNISQLEEDVFTSLQEQLPGLMRLDSQVAVHVLADDELSVSLFPLSGASSWLPNDAARLVYALKDRNQFANIGPWNCLFYAKPYIGPGEQKSGLSAAAKLGLGVSATVFAVLLVILGAYAVKQNKRAEKAERLNKPFGAWIAASRGDNEDTPKLKGARWFSLAEIRKCTDNFSQRNEIGEGGYGKVYMGYLSSGECVAVKRAATESLQGALEFKKEIEHLSRVHHRNLLCLVGFCFEDAEQMLVYEYMANGNLSHCLSGRSGIELDWEKRISFALGSARGIAYLHYDANPPIIHGDIKSSNILLDDKLMPKVADFGLSAHAINDDGNGPGYTDAKGTLGYLDPDYFMTRRLTEKSDVFSFGVILLELVTGRPPVKAGKHLVREINLAVEKSGLVSVAKTFTDPRLTEYPPEDMERLLELSLRCVEDEPSPRPSMSDVVRHLEPLAPAVFVALDVKSGKDWKNLELDWSSPQVSQTAISNSFGYSGSYGSLITGR